MGVLLERIKRIISVADHIDIPSAQTNIRSNIDFMGPNIWILACAIIMASVGLNVNSIPVIIGAMLISPLMGPIIGIGLALGINDMQLLKKSFTNLLIMTGISVLASSLFFFISPLSLEEPTELLARTNPTIYDVFIALFGGFAVIIEVCKKEKGTVIAGAAIATALMPPLCTAGFGIASGSFSYFMGAIYLYFINSVFIALATYITVRILKFPMVQFSNKDEQKKVNRIITAFTLILIIPSIYSAIMVIKESKFNQIAKTFVTENKHLGNSYIYDYRTNHYGARKGSTVTISIAGEALSEETKDKLGRDLELKGIDKDRLIINQSTARNPDKEENTQFLKGIFEQNEQEILRREELIAQMEKELKALRKKELPARQIAREIAAQYPQITGITLARGESIETAKLPDPEYESGTVEVIVLVKLSRELSDEETAKLRQWLSVRLDISTVKILEEK